MKIALQVVGLFFLVWMGLTGCSSDLLIGIQEKVGEDIAAASGTPTYNVTYHGNGNTAGDVPVDLNKYEEGDTVNVFGNINDLVRAEYTFVNWNTEPDGSGTTYLEGPGLVMGNADVDLHARWTDLPTYTVSFDSQGGSAANSQMVIEGDTAISPVEPVRSGYHFGGWFKEPSCINQWNFGTDTVFADITLYANWTPYYMVIYHANGATGGTVPIDSNTYLNGDTATVADNSGNLARTGFVFSGWNTNSAGTGTTYLEGESITVGSSDTTLFAKWKELLTVTFGANGGTGTMADQEILQDTWENLNLNTYTRVGHLFTGWATSSGGAVAYNDGESYPMGSGDVTLYAKWLIQAYTISFDRNDLGATGSMADQGPVTYGSNPSLDPNAFLKGGWTFAGWATSPGGGVVYLDNAAYTVPGYDSTLYAKWTPPAIYSIGDRGPGGGWIFYDAGTPAPSWGRYLEASAANLSTSFWGNWGISVGSTSEAIGTGAQNTADILADDSAENKAADRCADYSVTNGGVVYDDWFLPSYDELVELKSSLWTLGIGNLVDGNYWSSSENSTAYGLGFEFIASGQMILAHKSNSYRVRGVRAVP